MGGPPMGGAPMGGPPGGGMAMPGAAAGMNPVVKYVAIGCGALFVLSCLASIAWQIIARIMYSV